MSAFALALPSSATALPTFSATQFRELLTTLKGKPVAGIMQAMSMGDQPPPPPSWTSYFSSADADATQAAIEAGAFANFPAAAIHDHR